jgi:uncharacterized protein YqeY
MSDILTTIESQIVDAMKARQADRLSALRMMKTAIKNKQIENREKFSDAEAVKALQTLAKQRRESADAFRGAGREEQAAKEEAELAVVEEFLPAAASDADVEAAVAEAIAETGATSMRDVGRVMPAAMKRLAGKTVDGKAVNERVRAKLS